MQIKVFDCEHEKDLEYEVNSWLNNIPDEYIIDIQYRISSMYDQRSQIYCYSCMIIYRNDLEDYLSHQKKDRYK